MRVLQLISSGGYYGAESMIINLSRGLDKLGCEPHFGVFLNLHTPNTQIAAYAEREGFPVKIIPCEGRIDWQTVRTIRSYVETHRVDIVHTHGYKADLYGYAATRNTSATILATCHNWPPDRDANLWLYSVLDRLLLRRFGRLAAVSDGVARSLRRFGIPRRNITIVDNGIDFSAFASAEATLRKDLGAGSRMIVGAVGSLTPTKGHDYFLQAASHVRRQFPDVIFVLVGEGPERKKLEEMARTLGLAQNVVFAGQRHDMPGVYASLDLLVLSSRDEGMPMTVLEALAACKPVVASRVGAIPKVIENEKTGLLVEKGDVLGFSHAISALLSDRMLCRGLATEGRQRVRQFYSSDAMARRYMDLYLQLTGRLPGSTTRPLQPASRATTSSERDHNPAHPMDVPCR